MHIAITPRKIFAATLTMLIVLSSMSAYAGQWDGFFFGVNTGAALSNAKYKTGPDNVSWFRQQGLTDGMWNRGDRNQSRVSPLVGLSAAYNHQVDSYVFGAELGLNAIDADLDHDGTYQYAGLTTHYTYQQRTRLDGLLTLRGRAGIAFGDSLLSVTGGLAATQLKTGIDYWDDYSGGGQYFASRTSRKFALGPTVGLAYERLLPDDFALKAELTYVDFGKTGFSKLVVAQDGTRIGMMNFSSEQRLGIFTIGLEKKF